MAKADVSPIDLANAAPRCTATAKSTFQSAVLRPCGQGLACLPGPRCPRWCEAWARPSEFPARPEHERGHGATAQVMALVRESREVEQLLRL